MLTMAGAASSADIVEGVSGASAELADDASGWDLLVSRHTVSEPQHDVGKERVSRQERLLGQSPSHIECREGAPLVRRPEPGGAIAPHREAQIVPGGIVIVGLAKEG